MFQRLLNKFCSSNPILLGSIRYKNTKTQKKMHQFTQNSAQIQKQKSKINYYQTIGKQSQGCVMIRQFLFQQKQPSYQINFPEKYLTPSGKWTLQQLERTLQIQQEQGISPSQQENYLILNTLENELNQKFNEYYLKIGKKNYTYSVKQEVKKIQQMTPQQFEQFMIKLKK